MRVLRYGFCCIHMCAKARCTEHHAEHGKAVHRSAHSMYLLGQENENRYLKHRNNNMVSTTNQIGRLNNSPIYMNIERGDSTQR